MIALLLAAGQAKVPAHFLWEVRVQGETLSWTDEFQVKLEVGLPKWRCTYQVDPVHRRDGSTRQLGVVMCEHASGQKVDTLVLCMTSANQPNDHGSGNLLLTQGKKEVALEISCRSAEAPRHSPLQLEADTSPGDHVGFPSTRKPTTHGKFDWQLTRNGEPESLKPFQPSNKDWICLFEASGVTDPRHGYAEFATISCTHKDDSISTMVPCVRYDETPTCNIGSLRFAGDPEARFMLSCKNTANPGCF